MLPARWRLPSDCNLNKRYPVGSVHHPRSASQRDVFLQARRSFLFIIFYRPSLSNAGHKHLYRPTSSLLLARCALPFGTLSHLFFALFTSRAWKFWKKGRRGTRGELMVLASQRSHRKGRCNLNPIESANPWCSSFRFGPKQERCPRHHLFAVGANSRLSHLYSKLFGCWPPPSW